MRRRPSDRTLRRWLATGRPRRVARLIEHDHDVALRVDELTALTRAEATALTQLITPSPLFEQRTVSGVQRRVESHGLASTVVDLLGLGFHTGRLVFGDPDERRRPRDDRRPPPGA